MTLRSGGSERIPGIGAVASSSVLLLACTGAPAHVGPDAMPHDGSSMVDVAIDAAVPGAWTASPPCTASAAEIYATPSQVAGPRGSIVACALGDELQEAEVQAELDDTGAAGVSAQTGARVVKLSYRTVRSDGTATVSSASAYLPLVPRAVPAPIVLIGRPTAGLADACAPSKEPRPARNLALPFAARGFVTITPDYAGLGTDGVHAYLDNHEAATELFDGARALQLLVPGDVVGDPLGAVGYSQGGGIVLSAQALEHELTGKRTLRGVAALAAQWPISTRSFGYEDVLRNPGTLTVLAGLAPPTVTVMRHYGFLSNRIGGAANGAAFPASEREDIIEAIESLCTVPLGGALDVRQPRLRDLVDDTFRLQVLACIDGAPGCAGHGAAFHTWMTGDFVTADPAGARVLIVHGLGDQVMPAAGEAACNVAKLRTEGVEPTLCIDNFATHDSVLERRIEDIVAWIEAVATGAEPAMCGSQALPACSR